jgi:uncharacterized membrane protein YtjA (UPF0391 family)
VGPHLLRDFRDRGLFRLYRVASTTRSIAKVLFFIALAIFLIVLIFGVMLGMLVF